jgi:hypothetical protein
MARGFMKRAAMFRQKSGGGMNNPTTSGRASSPRRPANVFGRASQFSNAMSNPPNKGARRAKLGNLKT